MIGKITVEGIEVYGFHGCLEEEARIGGKYIVNVSLWADLEQAASTDNLDETIDYVDVNAIVAEEMEIRSRLIEHVCLRIQTRLLGRFSQLMRLTVEVIKIAPPINGNVRNVSFELDWSKDDTTLV